MEHVNGHAPSLAPTELGARMMHDGALADIAAASGADFLPTARLNVAILAGLCRENWFDAATVFHKLEHVGTANGEAATFRGILIGEFAGLYAPDDFKPAGDLADCIAAARRSVATAPDKVAAIEAAALALAIDIEAGRCSRPDAADALTEMAEQHGVAAQLGPDGTQHIIAMGLKGVAALAPRLVRDDKPTLNDAHDGGPLPLIPELAAAEIYPVDALGPVLGVAARAIANKVQAPIELAAQSVLAAAALAAQAHADVRLPHGQVRPLSLFLMSVAGSGDRKTATDQEALRPIQKREHDLAEWHSRELETWRIAAGAWQGEKRSIENSRKLDFEGRKTALKNLGPEPLPPLHPILTAPEPTIEGLAKFCQRGPAALGLFSAEGGQFTGGHGMSQEHRLKTAAALSALWDGAGFRRIRAGDGVVLLPGRRVSFHIMIQPGAALGFLCDQLLRDQGLLSRVLVVAPSSLAGSRSFRACDPADETAVRRYTGVILSLLEKSWPLADGRDNELCPPALMFSDDAETLWRQFHDAIECQLGTNARLASIRDFAGKAPEHAARIAGVLAIVENSQATEITADHFERAAALAGWYVNEALRLAAASMTDPAIMRAARLLEWWRSRPEYHDGLSLRSVMQLGPSDLRSKAAAESALRVLTDHKHARQLGDKRPRWALESMRDGSGAATLATTATLSGPGAGFVANVASVAGAKPRNSISGGGQ